MDQERLDKLLLEKKLTTSRTKALNLIKEGKVLVNGIVEKKASKKFAKDVVIELKDYENLLSYGSKKLQKAISYWKIDLKDKVCADFGASTGGFTKVLLEHNAKKIYAIDVGHNQLDSSLIKNKKVINKEKVNLKSDDLLFIKEKIDFIACDLSFISITKILNTLKKILNEKTRLIILIKPQFELSKKDIEKGGIVKKEEKRKEAIQKVVKELKKINIEKIAVIKSPKKDKKRNQEYLFYGKTKKENQLFSSPNQKG